MDTSFTSSSTKRNCQAAFYRGDGWKQFISTKQTRKNQPAFARGTVSPPDPRPIRWPGQENQQLRRSSRAVATDEREPPSRVDTRQHRSDRCDPILPDPLQAHLLRRRRRHIQFASPVSGKSESVVRRKV